MTYLSDRKAKRNRTMVRSTLFALLFLTVFYWPQIRIASSPVLFFFADVSFSIKTKTNDVAESVSSWFSTKKTLEEAIRTLEEENGRIKNELAIRDSIIKAYDDAYKTDTRFLDSTLEVSPLFSPFTSLYNSLVVSKGFEDGVSPSLVVYTAGYIPLGVVETVGPRTSVVRLLSSPGNELEGIIISSSSQNTAARISGIGGGDFETFLPKDALVEVGSTVTWKEHDHMKLGIVVSVENEPQAISQKIIIRGFYNPAEASRLYIDIP